MFPGRAAVAGASRHPASEGGFRFFPGFYRNLPDTLRRIPFPGNANGVHDNLRNGTDTLMARSGGRPDLHAPVRRATTPSAPGDLTAAFLRETVTSALDTVLRLPAHELAYFANRLLVHLTSCGRRREEQWEKGLLVGLVHPVPAFRHRDPPRRVHNQRDRVRRRPHPQGRPSPGTLPKEQAALECVYVAHMSLGPNRQGTSPLDQPLEGRAERLRHHIRRTPLSSPQATAKPRVTPNV